MLADIHHVSINITDLHRSLAFYVGVLGLEVLPRPDLSVDGAWLAAGAQRQVHLIVAEVPPNRGQHFAFLVSDIDAVCRTLEASGITIDGPRSVGNGRQAFFADPDGNRIEVNQPA